MELYYNKAFSLIVCECLFLVKKKQKKQQLCDKLFYIYKKQYKNEI